MAEVAWDVAWAVAWTVANDPSDSAELSVNRRFGKREDPI